MNISLNCLKDYVKYKENAQEFAHKMTMAGSNV